MRRIRGAVVGGLIGVLAAACGGSVTHAASRTPTVVSHHPVQAIARGPAPGPSPPQLGLARSLGSDLRKAGASSGADIYDLTAGRTLYSVRGGIARPPASVEKLYTSLAVLTELGAATELSTSVLGSGHLGPRGVWQGDLYLRGGGDPSFGDGTFNQVWEEGYGPTAEELATQLRRAGIRRVTGWVIGDE